MVAGVHKAAHKSQGGFFFFFWIKTAPAPRGEAGACKYNNPASVNRRLLFPDLHDREPTGLQSLAQGVIMRYPRGVPSHGRLGCCPDDWDKIPDITGSYELDAVISKARRGCSSQVAGLLPAGEQLWPTSLRMMVTTVTRATIKRLLFGAKVRYYADGAKSRITERVKSWQKRKCRKAKARERQGAAWPKC